MTPTQEQIDAMKADCEKVGADDFATLPAGQVLELINSHAQQKERIEELEKALQGIMKIDAESKSLLSAIHKTRKAQDLARAALSKGGE